MRPLHELEIAHGGQLQAQVLHCLVGAIDDGDIQHDVVLVHCDICLCIYRVREACMQGLLNRDTVKRSDGGHPTSELEDTIEAVGIGGLGVSKARRALQVGGHLVL